MKRRTAFAWLAAALCLPSRAPSAQGGTGCDPAWAALASGINANVWALEVFDDGSGSGPALYAGGDFLSEICSPADYIARWDGSTWSALGGGVNGPVYGFAVFDDGSGPALFVSGEFTLAGGQPAENLARWNGSSWSALPELGSSSIGVMIVFDDGSGPALYAAVKYGVELSSVSRVQRWNGASWSQVGGLLNLSIRALTVFEGEGDSGPTLWAGGDFPPGRIAWWDGTSWRLPAAGGLNGSVTSLLPFDDGSGLALYAGGSFTTAGGVGAVCIARLAGTSWSAVGSGMSAGNPTGVQSLGAFNDGSGPALYAGGNFTVAGGVSARRIARWDGSSWAPLAGGVDHPPASLAAFDDALVPGPTLYLGLNAGFNFICVEGSLERWQGCDHLPPTISCPPFLFVSDAGPPGEFVTLPVSAIDEGGPTPTLVCNPPSGSFFPRGTTMVTCTAIDASGNQSMCMFPVVVMPTVRERRL